MDPKQDPTAKLTDELRDKASGCAVLMIVISNRYLKSSWCRAELEWFRAQVQARPGDSGRVFVLRAQKTDESLWPEFLRDSRDHAMTGFTFHDPKVGDPWGFQLERPGDEFFKELARLRNWLTKRLHEMRDRAAKRAHKQANADTPAPPHCRAQRDESTSTRPPILKRCARRSRWRSRTKGSCRSRQLSAREEAGRMAE
jgi:TIR domain